MDLVFVFKFIVQCQYYSQIVHQFTQSYCFSSVSNLLYGKERGEQRTCGTDAGCLQQREILLTPQHLYLPI